MWSRRHFANARPGGILVILKDILTPDVSEPVVDNLGAMPLPRRRLRLKPTQTAPQT